MDKIKGFKWETVLTSVLYVVVGILLMMFPESIAKTLCYTIAIVIMAIGVIKLVSFFIKKEQEGFMRTGAVSGFVFILIGAFIAIKSRMIISIIPFIIGIIIILSGLSKLQYSVQLKKYAGEKNTGMMIMAVINIVLGVFLAFNPFSAAKWMIRLIGICIGLTGASDLISAVYFYGKMRNHIKDMEALDQDYKEK